MQALTPFKRLEQLERLLLGVQGKLALWDALKAIVGSDAHFDEVNLETLGRRAEGQFRGLERYRMATARDAFMTEAKD